MNISREMLIPAFESKIDSWVLHAIENGCKSFNELILSCHGVYPVDVSKCINRLISKNISVPNSILPVSKNTTSEFFTDALPVHLNGLPLPHPLDFDWRFSSTSFPFLYNEITNRSDSPNSIMLFGAPSLYLYFLNHNSYFANISLFDANKQISKYLPINKRGSVNVFDAFKDEPLPEPIFDAAILDPPWYEDHTKAFLWCASKMCKSGSILLLSTPSEGTRPGVREEWDRILNWVSNLGVTLVEKKYSVLSYKTPLFEANSLCKEGIFSVPSEWRRSDLAIFKLHSKSECVERPIFESTNQWEDVVIRSCRIKIKKETRQKGKCKLLNIVNDDILQSVSRWHSDRQQADIWTSGNRIYSCGDSNLAIQLLLTLQNSIPTEQTLREYFGRNPTTKELSDSLETIDQLQTLINKEEYDFKRYTNE
jgi:hypothetical protein